MLRAIKTIILENISCHTTRHVFFQSLLETPLVGVKRVDAATPSAWPGVCKFRFFFGGGKEGATAR